MVSNNGGIPDASMLKKGRTTRFRSNYHPELSVEDMLSINSIQRRTVTTCLNTDQVMFSLLSIQLHKILHRERR
jgi:hypothetical protein